MANLPYSFGSSQNPGDCITIPMGIGKLEIKYLFEGAGVVTFTLDSQLKNSEKINE